jgi:oligopeptide/dipeptide ABC transporter ATP-binding protein
MSSMPPTAEPLLEVRDLVKHYPARDHRGTKGVIKAVDGVDLEVAAAETVGLVGESGCGKSTLARLLMALERPTSGTVHFEGQDIFRMSKAELKRLRRQVQMVMQDPYSSLDPRLSIRQIIAEPFEIHPDAAPRGSRDARVRDLMAMVGLDPDHSDRYPHQFSGGQRQRVGIARALALQPRLLICDEPVSALDVSIQAQVLNLLKGLQSAFSLAYVFIAHDLSVVRHVADRVAVMYLGRVVELGDRREVFADPAHPYTQALMSAVPLPDPSLRSRGRRLLLVGDPPSAFDPPSGCHFRTRCWMAESICAEQVPALTLRPGTTHPSACHFAGRADRSWAATEPRAGSMATEPRNVA